MMYMFYNKNVKVVKNDGFVLRGTVIEIDDNGLFLSNKQTTGWHSFNNIREIVLDE